MTLILFILILGLIIFIHELGHFIFAKKAGIYVYEFSLGFGPKLFSFRRKNDETEYMIRLIPLGGYVALAGETYEEEEPAEKEEKKDKKSKKEDTKEEIVVPEDKKLYNKSFLRQFSVMVAGVFNNFLLGLLLLFIIGLAYGSSFSTNELIGLKEGYPLYELGARDGDKITKINGKSISDFDDVLTQIAISGEGKEITVTYSSNGKENTSKLKPTYDKKEKKYFYGIATKTINETGPISALKYAFYKFKSIFKQLIIIIISLFTGKLGINSLSGPVGIYQVVGIAKSSMESLLYLTAYLSINVGFMNILPFPAFDGGRAFLLIIEKITKKKVPLKVETIINNIGFILLMGLMVYITIKDVLNLF
ncbi:MAG: site-2 protease family protein [Bacilli bacterium]|nr:site-2 protease family protein [Bacilli bacterium]